MTAINQNRLDDVLAGAVRSGTAPGVVATVVAEGTLLYEGAFGVRDVRLDEPIAPDTIFRIASMTKLVTAVCVLQQVEAGRLTLDQEQGIIAETKSWLTARAAEIRAYRMYLDRWGDWADPWPNAAKKK